MIISSLIHGEVKAVGRAILDGEAWRVPAHVRAWCSAFVYLPSAVWERARRKARGIGHCRFWDMVRRDMLYFRGAEFPEHGWYAARDVLGARLRPMGARATMEPVLSVSRITHGNPHPALGETDVSLLRDGEEPIQLRTASREDVRVDPAPGILEFVSHKIFDADDTGELADFGGWLRVEAE